MQVHKYSKLVNEIIIVQLNAKLVEIKRLLLY